MNNQEIRNCIFSGRFNTLLKDLAAGEKWKKLLDLKKDGIYRFANEEIILRFFTFFDNHESYSGKLAKFLNDYMQAHKNPQDGFLSAKQSLFNDTVDIIQQKIFDNNPIGKISKATLEGLLVGVGKNVEHLKQKQPDQVKQLYHDFRELQDYSVDNLKEGLSAKDKVTNRINSAIQAFAK